tara:strand:+ start:2258 stop:2851 length:594 start_codon:yes stop_codon:yes gene_type:complete
MKKTPFPSDPSGGKGYRCFLSAKEIDQYVACSSKTSTKKEMNDKISIAVKLAAWSGLRIGEIAKVKDEDRFTADDGRGLMLKVIGKGEVYRETVLPPAMEYADFKLVNGKEGVTFSRWAKRVNKQYVKTHGDEDFLNVRFHDLRRSFITRLLEDGAVPEYVMTLSGHKSADVFYKHYVNVGSPEFAAQERLKSDWLN